MKLYKMVIVDDEEQIREGLKKIIPWKQYGIEIQGEAENGEQALELLKILRPQIVFTDIRMPGMDGLELLRKIKEEKLSCKVIIISGYDDFEYVRQAMRYGAVDYLLKPLGKNEIIRLIEEIIDTMEDEVISKLNNEKDMKLAKINFLNRLIHNSISPMEAREKQDFFEESFLQGDMCIATMRLLEKEDRILEVYQICEQVIGENENNLVFRDGFDNICILLSNIQKSDQDSEVGIILKSCIAKVKEKLHLNMTAAVGNVVKSYRGIRGSYYKAIETMEYRYVFGNGIVLFFDEIKEYFQNTSNHIKIDKNQIHIYINKKEWNNLKTYIQKIFVSYEKQNPVTNYYTLRNCAIEICFLIFQAVENMQMSDRIQLLLKREEIMRDILSMHTGEDICRVLTDGTDWIAEKVKENPEQKYSRAISHSLNYIRDHYMESTLSLQTLADECNMNVAYLGRTFTKETGKHFADYLNELRVEKAKELLMTSNYKGSELCEKVGFTSYNYFYIVFKKITGMKPTDVRK